MVLGLTAQGTDQADFSRNFEFSGDSSPFLLVIGGASLAFYALIGFEDSVNVAEEVPSSGEVVSDRPARRAGGRGHHLHLVTMTASAVVPTQQLADSDGPLLEVVKEGPLSVPTTLFSGIALFALFNGALINMILASRLVYGMAEEGIVPSVLGRVSPARRTPFTAIVFTTLIAAALVLTGDLEALADTTVALLLLVFTIVNVAVLILRRDPVDHDHFRTPTFIPVLGAIVSLGMFTQHEAGTYLRAGILLVVGVVLWFVNRAAGRGTGGELNAENLAD